MLFADVVGYSTLTEQQIPHFVEHFMGGAAKLLPKGKQKPLSKRTWGDALFIVFASLRDAGRFALDLRDFLSRMDWRKFGLPPNLNVRIGLHAGPVYPLRDPISLADDFTGAHVTRAARIEPITPPGEVYASQAFAALASAQGVTDFICDYVGQIPLAKGYGTLPMHHVRRTSVATRS